MNKNKAQITAIEEAKESYPYLLPFFELEEKFQTVRDGVRNGIEARTAKKLSSASIKEKLTRGEPLISITEMEIDWGAFSRLLDQFSDILAKHTPETSELVKDFSTKSTDVKALLKFVNSEAEEKDEFALFLVLSTLKPFLDKEREALLPLIDQELWIRRYCPVCGGTPDFSLLEDEVGIRSLVCSRCDAKWRYKRLECPFCGTEDASKLAYYPSKDKAYRLYVCDNCKHYLKALDLRVTPGEPDISIERLVTFDLDIAAREAGYS